jgi:hypothetical protein
MKGGKAQQERDPKGNAVGKERWLRNEYRFGLP